MDKKKFTLWLEFEALQWSDWDPTDDFCNIGVDLPDGRSYGINVWTYRCFHAIIKDNETSGEYLKGQYLKPPDLFVKELTRACIEAAISDLLNKGDLEEFLNPSIFNIRYETPWVHYSDLPDLGKNVETLVNTILIPGHLLYEKVLWLEAQREDKEFLFQLKNRSLALVRFAEDNKGTELSRILIFGDKKDFWERHLRHGTQDD